MKCRNNISEDTKFCPHCGTKRTFDVSKKKLDAQFKISLLIALAIICACGSIFWIVREKIYVFLIEKCLEKQRFETVLYMPFIEKYEDPEKDLSEDGQLIKALLSYTDVCNEIQIAFKNPDEIEESVFLEIYNNQREHLEKCDYLLPDPYKSIWYEINRGFHSIQVDQFCQKSIKTIQSDIIDILMEELHDITQTEKAYSISELKELLEEKEKTLDQIKEERQIIVTNASKYMGDVGSILEGYIELATKSIQIFSDYIHTFEFLLKNKFQDYTDYQYYITPLDWKETLIVKNAIESLYRRMDAMDDADKIRRNIINEIGDYSDDILNISQWSIGYWIENANAAINK